MEIRHVCYLLRERESEKRGTSSRRSSNREWSWCEAREKKEWVPVLCLGFLLLTSMFSPGKCPFNKSSSIAGGVEIFLSCPGISLFFCSCRKFLPFIL